MPSPSFCPHCKGTDIYHRRVSAKVSNGDLDLLPGIGRWFDSGKFDVYICGSCGHVDWFLQGERLQQLREKWDKVNTAAPASARVQRSRPQT